MSLTAYFETPAHRRERAQLPLLQSLADRYSHERPFAGVTVVFGHLLVRNAMVMVEALHRGGAQITLAKAHPSPAEAPVQADLAAAEVTVLPLERAVERGNLYLDVGAVLGRARQPKGAAEVTRTGVLHYQRMAVPVVSADDCRAKLIEGFFGTGDGLRRAWDLLRPDDPLRGKRVAQFGFGKIGRGVAWRLREAGNEVIIFDPEASARSRARQDGFTTLPAQAGPDARRQLSAAEVIVAVTGVPGAVGRTIPVEWLGSEAVLVNIGAEDEFGPSIPDDRILGDRRIPLNFHLERPTLSRYIDPSLAAHLLALEALISAARPYPPEVHPLPQEMDDWIIRTWRALHPDEDLSAIGADLALST